MLKTINLIMFPAIRVHAWGGFGSQLFALIIAERLLIKNRFRQITIVFHTSGVTERKLEIPKTWLVKFRTVQVSDYQRQSFWNSSKHKNSLDFKFRKKLKQYLNRLGVTASSDSEEEFLKLKPWILSIRGHYTGIHLMEAEIQELMSRFELSSDTPLIKATAVHYRLGDLMTLNDKGIISPHRIIKTWRDCVNTDLPLQIFSDGSQKDFESVWREADGPPIHLFGNASPIQTIQSCFNAEEFLGTNAKISLWVAIFRYSKSLKQTHLPAEMQHQLEILLRRQNSGQSIQFY